MRILIFALKIRKMNYEGWMGSDPQKQPPKPRNHPQQKTRRINQHSSAPVLRINPPRASTPSEPPIKGGQSKKFKEFLL